MATLRYKLLLVLAAISIFLPHTVKAEEVIIIDRGITGVPQNTTFFIPNVYYGWSNGSMNHILIRKEELESAGMSPGGGFFTSFGLMIANNLGSQWGTRRFTIRMKETTLEEFPQGVLYYASTDWSGFEMVYENNASTITALMNEWQVYEFDSPFEWTGQNNIIVELCTSTPTTGTYPPVFGHTPNFNANAWSYGNMQNCGEGAWNQWTWSIFPTRLRPHMRFEVEQTPQSFVSAGFTHPDLSDVFTGASNQVIGRLDVVMEGTAARRRITNLRFNLNGTTLLSDVLNARIWSTGLEASLEPFNRQLLAEFTSTAIQNNAGDLVANLTGAGVQLSAGTNYFWLTVDLTPDTLAAGRRIDGEAVSFIISGDPPTGGVQIPDPSAPVGSRLILRQPRTDMRTLRVDRPYDAGSVFQYPTGFPMPVRGVFQNVGSLPATKIRVSAKVRRPNNSIIFERERDLDFTMPGIGKDSIIFYEFGTFTPDVVGNYSYEVCTEILAANDAGTVISFPGIDEIAENNCKDSIFVVNFITDFKPGNLFSQSFDVALPTGTPEYWSGRPIRLMAQFENSGLVDGDLIPARMTVTPPAPHQPETFDVIIPSVAARSTSFAIDFTNNAFVDVTAPANQRVRREAAGLSRYYVPPAPGSYSVTIEVFANDGDPSNNTRQYPGAFTVADNMEGTYSIGPANLQPVGALANFATVDDAVNALYIRGVKGPVTFLMTADRYVLSSSIPSSELFVNQANQLRLERPALNLSGKILGVSAENTITFRAASNRNIPRGVIFELRPNNGKGIFISQAQDRIFNNPYAIGAFITERLNNPSSRGNSNSNGNFIFDGGSNKALVFQMRADAPTEENAAHRAAVYIGRGVSNVAVRNVIIEDSTATGPLLSSVALPSQIVGQSVGSGIAYDYEQDIRFDVGRGVNISYSAGIVNRNTAPVEDALVAIPGQPRPFPNPNRLDTLINSNNRFEGNVISGFAIGIAGMGAGPLLRSGSADFEDYYNRNTRIIGNEITNGQMGIFMGFERDARIENNYIHDLSAGGSSYAIGVTLGAQGLNYNNQGMVVNRNEVVNISSQFGFNAGIQAHQSFNSYIRPNGQARVYPRVNTGTVITNNVVRNVEAGAPGHTGIAVRTRRNEAAQDLFQFLVSPAPGTGSLFTEGDLVANNTVIMPSLSPFVTNIGGADVIGGITIQQARLPEVYNNAIALLESNAGVRNLGHAAIIYQGEPVNSTSRYYNNVLQPREFHGLRSDNNAFYLASGVGSAAPSIAYVLETDAQGRLIDYGLLAGEDDRPGFVTPYPARSEQYRLLSQWRRLGNQDGNSVAGDFIKNDNFGMEYDAQRDAEAHLVTINGRVRINPDNSPIASILSNRGQRLERVSNDITGAVRSPDAQRPDIGAQEFTGRLILNELESVDVSYPIGYARVSVPNIEGVDKRPDSGVEYIMSNDRLQTIKARFKNNSPQPATNVPVRVTVIREAITTGGVVRLAEAQVATQVKNVNIGSDESVEVTFSFDDAVAQTFGELNQLPEAFWSMYWNVTPVYRIEIAVPTDLVNSNDRASKRVRLYVPTADKPLLLSSRGIQNELPANDQNIIAGKLNADSVVAGLRYNQWFYHRSGDNSNNPQTNARRDYDIIERAAWEVYEIDYSYWRTLVWSNGTQPLYWSERDDVADYLQGATLDEKRNFLVGSEQHLPMFNEFATIPYQRGENRDYVNYWLRSRVMSGQQQPLLAGYNGQTVRGVVVGTNIPERLEPTGYPGDVVTVRPRIMGTFNDSRTLGLTQAAYVYDQVDPDAQSAIMGIATTDPEYNMIHYGVEWRHFGRIPGDSRSGIARVLRTSFDYFDQNQGTVVPVELSHLGAFVSGHDRITLEWETVSEQNSSLFEIERATLNAAGRSRFESIGTVGAAGYSSRPINYNFVDEGLRGETTYIYRLRMIDLDGSWEYSGEVEATLAGGSGRIVEGLSIEQLLPNPTTNESHVRFRLEGSGITTVFVYDNIGNEVIREELGMRQAGEYKVRLDVSRLASGSYRVLVVNGDRRVTTSLQVIR